MFQYIAIGITQWDWRNHFKDELGNVMFCKRKNGTGFYSIIINDTGYGFHMFVDIVKSESTYQDFNDIKSFYKTKCKELGIKTKNIEVNEKY